MPTCNVDHSDYKNNGLITKIWGEPGWITYHSITFGYPINPTEEDKYWYRMHFVSMGYVLPCRYCRESYQKFITTGETALTDIALENRDNFTKWFYKVHCAVNAKLEVNYSVTYEEFVERYESFRAKCGKPDPNAKGCIAPLDYKAFSFKKLYYSDASIIDLDMAEKFVALAKARKLDERYFSYIELARELNGDFSKLKLLKSWEYRNELCRNHIRYMRVNAIPSVEPDGIYAGTPTMDELVLILFLSSNLNRTELTKANQAQEKLNLLSSN